MPDVSSFDPLAGKDENARVQIARRVGKYLSVDDLPKAERKAAEDLAQELVGDAVERVRRELSESVKHAKFLPKDVAFKIAHDLDSVACPFLEVTEIFSEQDWQQLLMTISHGALKAVASRDSMSESTALALAESGDPVVANTLVGNSAAPMTREACFTLIDRFEGSPGVLDKLAERDSLNAEIVVRLIEKVSAAVRNKLVETYDLPDHTAPIVTEAELAAILDIIRDTPEPDLRSWALKLKKEGRLTGSFLLMAIRDDALAFFETSLSVLSGERSERSRAVVRHEGKGSVSRLLNGAHIPSAMHKDFWIAIQEIRNRHQGAGLDASA